MPASNSGNAVLLGSVIDAMFVSTFTILAVIIFFVFPCFPLLTSRQALQLHKGDPAQVILEIINTIEGGPPVDVSSVWSM